MVSEIGLEGSIKSGKNSLEMQSDPIVIFMASGGNVYFIATF